MWRKFPGILTHPDFFSSDSCGRSLWAFRREHTFFILGVHLSRRFLLSSKVGASRPGGILAPALTTQLGWWSVVLKVGTMARLAMAVPCTATNHPEYTMYIYLDKIAAHNARMPLYKDQSISRWCATKTFRTQTLKGPKTEYRPATGNLYCDRCDQHQEVAMEDKISWFSDVFRRSRLVRLHFPTTFWDNANLGAPDSINSINILHFGANLICVVSIF